MTSLIKNQVLKHLTKFFKDLAPEQLQLSAFKGSCELSNLQLEENVLMDLLSFPAWIRINKATCDQLSIKIPWTKIKSVPIQMNLNEVSVEVEVCDEFRDVTTEDDLNLANLINTQAPGKYGFVDRVIDGITVTVNNVLITFKSKLMSATFNLSRVILESRCPNWKQGELSLTRIKDVNRSQILLFKIVEWQTMRLEAKCLTDPQQAPLRLITNHAQCRLTIKKKLDDCSVIAARIFVIFEDILWVLTFAQFISAASFVEYVFTLIKRSPISKKTGIFDDQSSTATQSNTSSNNSVSGASFSVSQSAPLISPINTPVHSNQPDKAPILTGNMSSASLLEQKFLCYDLFETSLHLYIDKVDAHLYDDIEISADSKNRDSGGALQTTLDQIQVDCYPYSRAIGDRKHWYRWFDPSPNGRKQWLNSHFAEFDLMQMRKMNDCREGPENQNSDGSPTSTSTDVGGSFKNKPVSKHQVPTVANEQLLSLNVLVKIKDYCMNCVATKHSMRGNGLNKFIQTDKDYHMPSEMPSLYLELNYFYYFDMINRMMVYEGVPDPLAFVHLSPTKLLFDSATLLFLNSFQANLSKALAHLEDLFPEETTAPKIHCRVEILMPQIILPAKSNNDQSVPTSTAATSSLLVKSGKITLSNSIYDKNLSSKLIDSIDKLKESPSQPINLGAGYQTNSAKKENSCVGDWAKVWNASIINRMSEFTALNQLWAVQFEPVWMDFMNYDIDESIANGQRLEPIVEPVNAYVFVHLDLSSPFKSDINSSLEACPAKDSAANNVVHKRDIISILATVMDGSILANMDKVQFSFLQRLGMHVEKLLQQIKADASGIIQMETVIENTLELNLTAYIKDIKARLILDKKVELQRVSFSEQGSSLKEKFVEDISISNNTASSFFNMKSPLANPFMDGKVHDGRTSGLGRQSVLEPSIISGADLFDYVDDDLQLDECAEVADDLFLNNDNPDTVNISAIGQSAPIPIESGGDKADHTDELRTKTPIEESLLINLDEMEQSSSLFAKVDLKSTPSPHARGPAPQNQSQQMQETESISYLELSMSQLMVRRITETKRRQKF